MVYWLVTMHAPFPCTGKNTREQRRELTPKQEESNRFPQSGLFRSVSRMCEGSGRTEEERKRPTFGRNLALVYWLVQCMRRALRPCCFLSSYLQGFHCAVAKWGCDIFRRDPRHTHACSSRPSKSPSKTSGARSETRDGSWGKRRREVIDLERNGERSCVCMCATCARGLRGQPAGPGNLKERWEREGGMWTSEHQKICLGKLLTKPVTHSHSLPDLDGRPIARTVRPKPDPRDERVLDTVRKSTAAEDGHRIVDDRDGVYVLERVQHQQPVRLEKSTHVIQLVLGKRENGTT